MITLSLVNILTDDPNAPIDNRGRMDFAVDSYKVTKKSTRVLIWSAKGAGASESNTPSIPKDGKVSVYYRNGIQSTTGMPYCDTWMAFVALLSDPSTPISNTLSGEF